MYGPPTPELAYTPHPQRAVPIYALFFGGKASPRAAFPVHPPRAAQSGHCSCRTRAFPRCVYMYRALRLGSVFWLGQSSVLSEMPHNDAAEAEHALVFPGFTAMSSPVLSLAMYMYM